MNLVKRIGVITVLLIGVILLILVNLTNTPVGNRTATHNCRLWGIIFAEQNQLVINTIETHLDSLRDLGTNHPDGWGIAYYVSPEKTSHLPVVVRGEPEAPLDPRFNRALDHVVAYAQGSAMAHVRSGSSGPSSGIPDPHPFSRYSAYRTFHMFFAHNGTLDTDILLDLIKTINPNYLDLNPPDYAPAYLDSDLYALLLMEIIDMNSDKSIEECIRIAVTKIDSAIVTGTVQCNFVMTDGTALWAVRYARSPLDALTLYIYSVLGRNDLWAVASEPLDSNQLLWTAIPNSTLVKLVPHELPRFFDILDYPDPFVERVNLSTLYPNPAKGVITIRFTLQETQRPGNSCTLTICNTTGQVVRTFDLSAYVPYKAHSVIWNGCDEQGRRLPGGVYLCHLNVGNTALTRKLVYIR